MITLVAAAWATADFDAARPAATFTGKETWLQDGTVQLWSAIERLEDPDRELFSQEESSDLVAWEDSDWAPWIATCFGSKRPHSSTFLLHIGPNEASATGTPVLFVPGAGDNGSRGFITMATKLDLLGRPVYSLTMAQSHGDALMQAEVIADAIARIKARTGATQVDLVAHSKGGISAAIYVSNHAGADWGASAYGDVGTLYRGDVRRLVLIATPLDGIDTAWRWPAQNLANLAPEDALSPSSWSWYGAMDLREQDFLPENGDLFPGQRQIARRQSPPLPGSLPWLGAYAAQPDWYTTYEGGLGFVSRSDGIDAAIEAGDFLLDRLEDAGVDPGVEIYILGGSNPLMHNGSEYLLASMWGEAWVDMATAGTDTWGALVGALTGEAMVAQGLAEGEVQGLAQGKLMLGEISAPSDGLVFVSSSTRGATLTSRGAEVKDTYVANLSHLDLLYASPVTGQLLVDAAEADPVEDGWQGPVGERYIEADTLGWLVDVVADPPSEVGDDPKTDEDAPFWSEWGVCGTPGFAGLGPALAGLALIRRKRR